MGYSVCSGAVCKCSFGVSPSQLTAMPTRQTLVNGMPVATIMDYLPMVNIKPFGMCTSALNPVVVAALGVPQPCIPICMQPWMPGNSKVLIKGNPALDNNSKCMCQWGGVISITSPGQQKVQI